jgi:peptidoglycan hydrolase-like protein with peptidoglycan-binding domain
MVGSTVRVESKEKAMTKVRNVTTVFALCGLAALPACSMFGGNQASRSGYSSHAATQSVSASPQSTQLSQDMIQQVQGRLQQQGIYRGSVDGVWGPGTESAVRSYQQQHNLNATGKLDADTLASLNLGTSQTYGNAPPADQRYGSNYNPPTNANTPNNNPPINNPAPDTSQPNTTTTR